MPQFAKRVCRPRDHLKAAGRTYPMTYSGLEFVEATGYRGEPMLER